MIKLGDDSVLLTGEELALVSIAVGALSLDQRRRLRAEVLQAVCDLQSVDKEIQRGDPCPCCGGSE